MFRMVTVTPPLRGSGEPLLPGGYEVGEKVFFTGASQTLSNGDKVMHGQQGKVTGACTSKALKGKGVNLRFPGNKGLVMPPQRGPPRPRRASAATPSPAPRTRDAAHTPRASTRQPLPRRASPHCTSSRSRRGPLPGCGRDGAGRGRGAGWPLWGRRPSPIYIPSYSLRGWWLRVRTGEPGRAAATASPKKGVRVVLPYTVGEKVFFTWANHTNASVGRA